MSRPFKHKGVACIGILLMFVFFFNSIAPAATKPTPEPEDQDRIEGRIKAMTLREKIGQMIMIDVPGIELTPQLASHLKDGHYGGIVFFEQNIQDEDQTRVFTRELRDFAVVDGGVPMFIAVDQEGGRVNRLGPLLNSFTQRLSARTVGQLFAFAPNRALRVFADLSSQMAKKMRHLGFNMNLAPVLDLAKDRDSYIYDRSFGGDPEKVTRITGTFADAMQSNGIIATGKHFPNLSFTRDDSHAGLPVLNRSLAQLSAYEFVPFKRLRNRLGAVMVGHVVVPEIDPKHPASVSMRVVKTLRDKVGWHGVVMTDDLKMKALTDHYPFHEILLRAIYADADILLMAWDQEKQHQAVDLIESLVKKGKIRTERIDESVRRILALKYRFNL